ncbi:hypothetical protein M2160_005314 [Streptomyces sp. SAI-117]|nr:hypothetical protein [Streptomyces sp. SAI-117]
MFGVEDGDERGETGGQPGGVGLQEQPVQDGVLGGGPLDEGGGDLGVRPRGDVRPAELAGELGDGLGTGEFLVATTVGPGHLSYQGRSGNRQETHLSRAAGPAAVQPAAEDQGGTETALVPQQHEVLVAAGGAEPLLGHGDEVDVVLVLDRHRQGGGEFVEEGRGVPAGEVGGVAQPARARVEGARGADDEPVDVAAGQPRRLHRAVEGLGDLLHDGLGGSPSRGRQFEGAHLAAGDVGDRGEDALGGDVEPGGVGGGRVDLVELGVGSRPALAGTGGEDEPRRLEAGQELGRGRLGEAGELADPRTGEGAVLQQEVERGTVVHGAECAWCACHGCPSP